MQFTASNTTDYSSRFTAAAGQAFNFDTNSQSVTLATPLASVGGSLTKAGLGTLTLSAANDYDGPTTIGGGVLVLGHTNALGGTSPLTFAGGTAFSHGPFLRDSLTRHFRHLPRQFCC